MEGVLRVHRVVIVPRGVFVTGVFTGGLRDQDGTVVGVDSRRLTTPADLVREGDGYVPVVRAFTLDLMGLSVDLEEARIAASLTLSVWTAMPPPGPWVDCDSHGAASPAGVTLSFPANRSSRRSSDDACVP